mmetsp:Transcript_37215/g.109837  ORF Transcript_37215/g.109837 Transcript_37215/m.109837 type:complete len:270 (+) Transcript_37215:1919-2728(+)
MRKNGHAVGTRQHARCGDCATAVCRRRPLRARQPRRDGAARQPGPGFGRPHAPARLQRGPSVAQTDGHWRVPDARAPDERRGHARRGPGADRADDDAGVLARVRLRHAPSHPAGHPARQHQRFRHERGRVPRRPLLLGTQGGLGASGQHRQLCARIQAHGGWRAPRRAGAAHPRNRRAQRVPPARLRQPAARRGPHAARVPGAPAKEPHAHGAQRAGRRRRRWRHRVLGAVRPRRRQRAAEAQGRGVGGQVQADGGAHQVGHVHRHGHV